jgi:glycine reductase
MELELADFPVREIRLGKATRYEAGVLEVDQQGLLALLRQDERIRDAALAIVTPGENVRITGIRDVVEPRVKVKGEGQIFPGTLSPVAPVGDGRTHRLSGMAVVAAVEYEGLVRSGSGAECWAILDMWGPGAQASRFSALINFVLVLRLAKGLSEIEAHTAIQQAEYRTAKLLAATTIGVAPEDEQRFALTNGSSGLPKVVLIQGCHTDSQHSHSRLTYYGLSVRDSLATFVHPNEMLDGALGTNATQGIGHHPSTWDWQNHPLVLSLYHAHAKRIHFAGVILERIRFLTHHGKEVIAENTARLAATLAADGALITWVGGGNAFIDVMLTIAACERQGIKTVLVGYEYGGRHGTDSPLLYYTPEADAMVSTGSRNRGIELPAADRLVGPYDEIRILNYPGAPVVPARSALSLDALDMIIGGVDLWGSQSFSCVEH